MSLLTDIHCHILPGIDDGAQTVMGSRILMTKENLGHVDNLVFKPHFILKG